MITEKKGDITQVTEGVILHCVNCQGVMGSGVALAIRNKWPEVYQRYKLMSDSFSSSAMLGTYQDVRVGSGLFVVNCFGQMDYGRDKRKYVSYDALDKCLSRLSEAVGSRILPSPIHFPLIGCGLAGGHWPIVREIIEHRLPDSLGPKYLWTL